MTALSDSPSAAGPPCPAVSSAGQPTGPDVHLAAGSAPHAGITGACGRTSAELPIGHSFTTNPGEVTCCGCKAVDSIYLCAVGYVLRDLP
jgi:hypothetical protein